MSDWLTLDNGQEGGCFYGLWFMPIDLQLFSFLAYIQWSYIVPRNSIMYLF